MEDTKVKKVESILKEGKQVTLYPIKRDGEWLSEKEDGNKALQFCIYELSGIPQDANGRNVDPLNDEEKEYFYSDQSKNKFDKKEDLLNLRNKECFWKNYSIKLERDEPKTLYLDREDDYLMYKYLLCFNNIVCEDFENRFDRAYKYTFKEVGYDEQQESTRNSVREQLYDHMRKIGKNKGKMFAILKTLNKQPARDANLDWLKNQIFKIVNSNSLNDMTDLLELIKDENLEIRAFIEDCIFNGQIKKVGKDSYEIEGQDISDYFKYSELIEFFSDKSNQELYLRMKTLNKEEGEGETD